jgi:23S rRNA pseudouridine2604 synthase
VDKPITANFLKQMAGGVNILDTKTLPCKITQLSKYEFNIVLTQGLNRQIRRMCESLGYQVKALKRIRIMNIHLGKLPVGRWRDLTKKEKKALFAELDYKPKI